MRRFATGLLALAAYVAAGHGQSAEPVKGTKTQMSGKAQEMECGCENGSLPEVLAAVSGVRISSKEIEEPIQADVEALHRYVIEARNRELEVQVNSKLVAAEARRRGLTVTRLLEQEVLAKAAQPGDAEARAYYDQNKERIAGKFEDVRDAVMEALLNQRQKEQAAKLVEGLRAAAQVKLLAERVTPPANAAGRARVLATVNGEAITSGDIEDALRPLIFKTQEQLHGLRNSMLNVKINGVLLAQEAQKRKITTDALLEAEITPKLKPVTEQDARTFCEQNKSRIEGDCEKLKDQVVQYLKDLERRRVEEAFAQRLRSGAEIKTFLRAPEAPVFEIATADQPSRGGPDAPVTIVEFTDFQCPSCAQTQPVLEKLAAEYGTRLRIVIRDFPLRRHADAFKAAEAAEAARAQGRYWEYVPILYANQSAQQVQKLKEYAGQLGLDRKEFDTALDSGKYTTEVERDLEDALKLGVNSTPTVFVNGRVVAEKTYDALKASIETALKDAALKSTTTTAQR